MDLSLVEAVAQILGDLTVADVLWGAFLRLWIVIAYQLAFWLVLVALAAVACVAAWLMLRPRARRP
jgi:hypothetical protein